MIRHYPSRFRSPLVLLGIALGVLMATPRMLHADSEALAKAQAFLDALDYERALETLTTSWQAGHHASDDLPALHRLLGEIYATLGRTDEAETHFRLLLALDPDASLPAGTSPKILEPFESARASGAPALAAECRAAEDKRALVATITSAPAGLVATVEAVYVAGDAQRRIEAAAGATVTLDIPAGVVTPVECAFLDQYGNRLVQAQVSLPDVTSEAAATTSSMPIASPLGPSDDDRSFYGRWYLWGALTALSAGSSIYFAARTSADRDELARLNAESSEHSYADALAIEERGEKHALFTNVSLGAAGIFGIVTAIMIVRGAGSSDTGGLSLTPLQASDGAGVSMTVRF